MVSLILSSALKTRRKIWSWPVPGVPAPTEKALVNKVNRIKEIVGAPFQCFGLSPSADVAPIRKIGGRVTEMIKGGVGAQIQNQRTQAQRCEILIHIVCARASDVRQPLEPEG